MKSINIPEVRLGIVAVSRDCFPIALSTRRRQDIVTACKTKGFEPYECSVTVENETDMLKAVEEVKAASKIHCVDDLLRSGATWEVE